MRLSKTLPFTSPHQYSSKPIIWKLRSAEVKRTNKWERFYKISPKWASPFIWGRISNTTKFSSITLFGLIDPNLRPAGQSLDESRSTIHPKFHKVQFKTDWKKIISRIATNSPYHTIQNKQQNTIFEWRKAQRTITVLSCIPILNCMLWNGATRWICSSHLV